MSKKIIIFLIASFAVTFICSIGFLLLGFSIGGNFLTDFEFMGARGYEATGNIGFIIGIIVGLVLSVIGYYIVFEADRNWSVFLYFKVF